MKFNTRNLVILAVMTFLFGIGVRTALAAVKGDTPAWVRYGAVNAVQASATAIPCVSGQNAVNVQNRGPNSIYLGGDANVTSATGTEIVSGGNLAMDVTCNSDGTSKLYVISVTADQSSPANTRYLPVR